MYHLHLQLVAAIAPSIWELDDVKRGILCQLFGGNSKVRECVVLGKLSLVILFLLVEKGKGGKSRRSSHTCAYERTGAAPGGRGRQDRSRRRCSGVAWSTKQFGSHAADVEVSVSNGFQVVAYLGGATRGKGTAGKYQQYKTWLVPSGLVSR